ncbi:redoxin domain-containing protein [Aquimarina hainanensis]|uniref:Redoxin domain-containing protein n=1 Tax=Aquimarina hainanensis TaxID=1578017 RepID=A0ABW5NFM3_9FLAO|nr:TlpA disulfide reductase family protein [Aquimarina sp. TRL1]QKX07235.1 AhpC/TSA family protein [Aquimarina sp. TRL1]
MNRIILLLVGILVIATACEKEKKGYNITAKTIGFEDGDIVYINALSQSNRPSVIDSVIIKNQQFSIALPDIETRDFNYLTFKTPAAKNPLNSNVLFIGENYPLQMTIYKDSLRSSVVTGGPENELFFKYISGTKSFGKQKVKLGNDLVVATRLKQEEKIAQIKKEQQELPEKAKQFRKEIAKNNPNSLVAIMALTDLMNLKIMSAKDVKNTLSQMDPSVVSSRLGKRLSSFVESAIGIIDVGSVIEDFSAPTPEGKNLSLKEVMGKYTIIDFWASWCKPCRAENPNVVRVYNKYHDKGLNIIGVSLDRNKDHWIKAIKDDNLQWSHISNLQYWQEPIAREFGVKSVPSTFLIDDKGLVIAKNLRGMALENKIKELLGEEEPAL